MMSEMETYMGESIDHMLGLPCSPSLLQKKLEQAERSQEELQLQVQYLQDKLAETQQKYDFAKIEASLHAQALKRQIAETQKVAMHCKQLTEECSRLENECMLYDNDRQVFMDAADEAEERAAEAEHRVTEELRETYEMEIARLKDDRVVHDAVTSAVNAGAIKAVEQERDAAVYGLKSSDRCLRDLFTEVQELRRDAQQYEANLKKAEVEVEFLYQENNELKLLLGGNHPASGGHAISPLHIQGIKCNTTKSPTSCSLLGLSSRQPLTPLRQNRQDWRRQYR